MTSDPPTAVPGAYVACVYDKNWFLGNVREASEENRDVRVNFMKRSPMPILSLGHKGKTYVGCQ